MQEIKLGIGFATGRKSFRKVLETYIKVWNNARQFSELLSERVRLHLFVSYDLEYHGTQTTDYTNLKQEIVDTFDSITFLGAKNALRSMEALQRNAELSRAELQEVFGAGYAGKRNAVLYAALDSKIDYLLFLDDDEYPMAVTKNPHGCLWSGQNVFLSHLQEIRSADFTNGYHCGYISPIPQITFGEALREEEFQSFIAVLSNDIINWENIRRLMESGGITYASRSILQKNQSEEIPLINGCKFISGANLCINLKQRERTLPFFHPPGARGEDTFLSTLLRDRVVKRIPCYTFHDGFSGYQSLLSGALPIQLSPVSEITPAVVRRFRQACAGWIRYKPLLVYLTDREHYTERMRRAEDALRQTLPKVSSYFQEPGFLQLSEELRKYCRNVERHAAHFHTAQNAWKKIMDTVP